MVIDSQLSGKRVVILGLARQGLALARFCYRRGATTVTVSDTRAADLLQPEQAALAEMPIRYVLGGHPLSLLEGCDLLCLSGGVPPDLPVVCEARRHGIPLSNDALMTLENCPAPVIGITGSSGKTTTTTLVGEMLKTSLGTRHSVWVGGNIGIPLVDKLDAIQAEDIVVLELSSFQLELCTRSPQGAAVLNVTPNHLDRHPSMEAYAEAKRNILRFQGRYDWAVLGYQNEWTRRWLSEPGHGNGQKFGFGWTPPQGPGAWVRNEDIVLFLDDTETDVMPMRAIRLRGAHNVLNALAASLVARLAGASLDAIRQVASTFNGVEHRLEWVRTLKDVTWYNDSIATAPERVVAALRSFNEPIVLLAGGRDKHLPWDDWANLVQERVRHVVAFGEAQGLIEEVMRTRHSRSHEATPGLTSVHTLDEAVQVAARVAQPGDVVLLSPGGTSYDAYKDFAARGAHFRKLVQDL